MSEQPVTLKKVFPMRKQSSHNGMRCRYAAATTNHLNGEFKSYTDINLICNSLSDSMPSWKLDESGTDNCSANKRSTWKPKNDNTPLQYCLKDKRQRHFYHTIELTNSAPKIDGEIVKKPPPLIPYKPHYLRAEYSEKPLPLVPPKVKNSEAVIQRRQLTEEYFENIIRNVDDEATSSLQNNSVSQLNSESLVEHDASSVGTILCSDSDSTSYSYKLTRQQNLVSSLKLLRLCGWYWGEMTWKEAETMLEQKPGEIGLFLIRDSQDPLHILTVTVRTDIDTIRHIRVEYTEGKFQLYDPTRGTSRGTANCVRHANVVSFIKLAMKHSRNGNFLYFVRPREMGQAPIQIQLLSPISRFSCVKSLKYYSRFVIRNLVPQESILQLPIPSTLQQYLAKPYYFDPEEDLQCALRS